MSNARRSVSMPPVLRLHLDCTFAAVRGGAAQIRKFLNRCGLAEKDIWACELAFVEGCNNAVEHTRSENAHGQIVAELTLDSFQVELRINEHSAGCVIPEKAILPAADSERGRGIFLMQLLMDEVRYIRSSSHNCLVLRKALTGI